jgi:hypothetical protein
LRIPLIGGGQEFFKLAALAARERVNIDARRYTWKPTGFNV